MTSTKPYATSHRNIGRCALEPTDASRGLGARRVSHGRLAPRCRCAGARRIWRNCRRSRSTTSQLGTIPRRGYGRRWGDRRRGGCCHLARELCRRESSRPEPPRQCRPSSRPPNPDLRFGSGERDGGSPRGHNEPQREARPVVRGFTLGGCILAGRCADGPFHIATWRTSRVPSTL